MRLIVSFSMNANSLTGLAEVITFKLLYFSYLQM